MRHNAVGVNATQFSLFFRALLRHFSGMREHIQKAFESHRHAFEIPANKVPLASPTYGVEEIEAALEVMLSSRVTQGPRVAAFETQFAEYIGSRHAVMVNSGSSANLLAVSALMSPHFDRALKAGDEVIVPAVTWPTTIYPFAQLGLVPVVVDADPVTFNISVAAIEAAITPKTRAVAIVPILGNPCDMAAIQKLCDSRKLILFEDTCESLGSTYGKKKCGTFGKVGTFSFFFSHHMTTIEGGMIVTDDDALADVLRSQRAHGWIRSHSKKSELERKYAKLDPRFLFIDWGYNFRSTDLNAAFGEIQLRKLPAMNEHRRQIAAWILEGLQKHSRYLQLPVEQANGMHTWFGFPFLVRAESGVDRQALMNHLEASGIETRPITGGNLTHQPAFEHFKWRSGGACTGAELIHNHGVYFGTHPGMNRGHCDHVIKAFDEFFKSR